MTNDTRSPEEIERDIEAQRSDLTSNLEDLQDKFSIDTVVRQIGDQFREHGGDMGRSISEQVKANPIPLALTGIGLAWMMFGSQLKQNASSRVADNGSDSYEDDYRRNRYERGQPYVAPTTHMPARLDGPSWARDDDDDGASMTDRLASGADAARYRAVQGAAAVKGGASSAAAAVSDTAGTVGSKVSDAAETAGSKVSGAAVSAKSSLTGAAQSAQSVLTHAGNRIADGTENLTHEGRARVIAARRKAVALRRQTAQSAQVGADAAADFYDRQPLVVGALALAVGAAFGGALPRSKTEDDLMGSQSDALMDDAERIFEEEKAKATSVAKSVQDEVMDIASETKSDLDSGAPGDKSAIEAIGEKAKSAVGRVADTAKATAKDEKLGKPKT